MLLFIHLKNRIFIYFLLVSLNQARVLLTVENVYTKLDAK